MSTFSLKCPQCGIDLEAEEKYLGAKVACSECNYHFPLWTPEESLPCYPDMLEEFKPGLVARAGLPLSFRSSLFMQEQLDLCSSAEESKRIFHFNYPLLRPVEETAEIDGYCRYWRTPIVIAGQEYFICKEWFDYNRKLLIFWLRQMEVDYGELKLACTDGLSRHSSQSLADIKSMGPYNGMTSDAQISPKSFSKMLDWSTLTMGITVPVKSHQAFKENLSSAFERGASINVLIHVQNKAFHASMINVNFSNPNRNPVIQIIWSRKSPIAQMLQATFSEAFAQLCKNHTNRNGIKDMLTVSCGKNPDEFAMELNVPAAEVPECASEPCENRVPSCPTTSVIEFQDFENKCSDILKAFFPKGFRLDSAVENKRFQNFWEQTYGVECNVPEDEIQAAMRSTGVEFENRVYAPMKLASEKILSELNDYIKQLFSEGKQFIYYQAIFDEFTHRGTEWQINSTEMLKSFLRASDCKYSLRRSCLAADDNVEVSPVSEIREYLQEQHEPVSYDKMQTALPHLPLDVIKHELVTNTEFVNSGRGEYIHADIVDLSDADLQCVAEMIREGIRNKGYITSTELWSKMEVEYSACADRYSHLPLVGFRDALKHKLNGIFNFQGNIISSVEEPICMADVFAGFCRRRDEFTLTDLEELCADVGAPGIYFDPVYEYSLRISQDDFVSSTSANFNIERVDEVLGRFCPEDFIAISEVTSFATFPDIGFQWTVYLLESYVAKYSKAFRLIHNQYNAKVCTGAIVRKTMGLLNYDEVLARALAKSSCELFPTPALDYLCNAGFLGRRRYTQIDIVLSVARQIRSKKGNSRCIPTLMT